MKQIGNESDETKNFVTIIKCQPILKKDYPTIYLPSGQEDKLTEATEIEMALPPLPGSVLLEESTTLPTEPEQNEVEENRAPIGDEALTWEDLEEETIDLDSLTVILDTETGEIVVEPPSNLDNSANTAEGAQQKPKIQKIEEMTDMLQKAIMKALQEHKFQANQPPQPNDVPRQDLKEEDVKTQVKLPKVEAVGQDVQKLHNLFKSLQKEAMNSRKVGKDNDGLQTLEQMKQRQQANQYVGSARHRQLVNVYGSKFNNDPESNEEEQKHVKDEL